MNADIMARADAMVSHPDVILETQLPSVPPRAPLMEGGDQEMGTLQLPFLPTCFGCLSSLGSL